MSNTFGNAFRVTTFGESHGNGIGAVIDGCPARLPLTEEDIQSQLDRRRPGQSPLTTPRPETDQVQILSGTENGITLGSPIALLISSHSTRASDYKELQTIPRPSHADFTTQMKYGIRSQSGGGRASARETAARVAAGAVAEKLLRQFHPIEIIAFVSAVGTESLSSQAQESFWATTRSEVDASPIRCPDPEMAQHMEQAVQQAKKDGDSVGGVITCVCRNIPAGWGEPVFDKLNACLAHAMISIPAARGFEIGSGFAAASQRGSQHNDLFIRKTDGSLGTKTNCSGGIQGGISNGEPIYFRVAFKPVPTILKDQETVDFDGNHVTLQGKGRHDPCVLPRAVPVVEAMTALVLADAMLQQKSQSFLPPI